MVMIIIIIIIINNYDNDFFNENLAHLRIWLGREQNFQYFLGDKCTVNNFCWNHHSAFCHDILQLTKSLFFLFFENIFQGETDCKTFA